MEALETVFGYIIYILAMGSFVAFVAVIISDKLNNRLSIQPTTQTKNNEIPDFARIITINNRPLVFAAYKVSGIHDT